MRERWGNILIDWKYIISARQQNENDVVLETTSILSRELVIRNIADKFFAYTRQNPALSIVDGVIHNTDCYYFLNMDRNELIAPNCWPKILDDAGVAAATQFIQQFPDLSQG